MSQEMTPGHSSLSRAGLRLDLTLETGSDLFANLSQSTV